MKKTLSLLLFPLFLMAGCSTVTIKHHAVGAHPPLCGQFQEGEKIVVYWGTAWRKDQKEVPLREKYIEEGLNNFFNDKELNFKTVLISRSVSGKDALIATDADLIAAGKTAGADKVVRIRVEELGPNLYLYLSPVLWQTKNEVLLQVRVLDTKTGKTEADVSTQRFRGGPFTLIGVKGLPSDLVNTLRSIFSGN